MPVTRLSLPYAVCSAERLAFWLDEASGLDRSNVGKAGATKPRKYSDYGSVQSPQALYAMVPSTPRARMHSMTSTHKQGNWDREENKWSVTGCFGGFA
jgi:hypothetical protein